MNTELKTEKLANRRSQARNQTEKDFPLIAVMAGKNDFTVEAIA